MVLQSDLKKLIDPEENYPEVRHQSLIDKYRIPLQHFEYSYIETCKDGKELEKIVQILRSGTEGHFPDLCRFAEERLVVIKPKSKLLRKACPVLLKEHLSKDEKHEITTDITDWITTVSKNDDELSFFKDRKPSSESLPEVRKPNETILREDKTTTKRISSTDYSSWDKYDPDTEILKMDLEEENIKKNAKMQKKVPTKKCVKFKEFTTDVEALHAANHEKDKGNEFYKAGDYEESLRLYTSSINCKPTLPGFNNRALVNIKLKRYKNALQDCNSALSIDPDNVKALVRKAQALHGLDKQIEALESIEEAIMLDPNNTIAQELAEKFRKEIGVVRKTTRFAVQDVETNTKSVQKRSKKEVIIPIPGTSKMSPPHFITCSDDNLNSIKEFTLKANTRNEIVHIVSVDASDVEDDDCCTINHLEKICSNGNSTHNKRDPDTAQKQFNQQSSEKSCKAPPVEKTPIQTNQQQTIKKDKNAGGEPYINERENIDIPDDIHSPFNFLKAWNSASIDKTLEQHANILRSIDMNRIVGVIGCKLDNTMFSTIIKCLYTHFAVPGGIETLHTILENIVHLPRFDIILMLMSEEDKNILQMLTNFLNQHGKPLSPDVFNKLFNNYTVPYIA